MNNLSYHICLTKGREIFLIISLSYYNCHLLHFSITPYNKFPVIYETKISIKVESSKVISIPEMNLFKNLIKHD